MALLKTSQWEIIVTELQFRFVRSSGPGGQKVNKTASKAELRWSLISTQAFGPAAYDRLVQKLHSQLTSDGDIVIQSDVFRSRLQNREEASRRLKELLEQSLFVAKKRKKTKPKKSAIRKRLNEKKQQGDKKRNRQKVDF